MRDCLYQDDAVTGEAAGLAMGLVSVGGLQPGVFQEMVQYVCDTQHDKIQRGLRAGIALLAYGHCFMLFNLYFLFFVLAFGSHFIEPFSLIHF